VLAAAIAAAVADVRFCLAHCRWPASVFISPSSRQQRAEVAEAHSQRTVDRSPAEQLINCVPPPPPVPTTHSVILYPWIA